MYVKWSCHLVGVARAGEAAAAVAGLVAPIMAMCLAARRRVLPIALQMGAPNFTTASSKTPESITWMFPSDTTYANVRPFLHNVHPEALRAPLRPPTSPLRSELGVPRRFHVDEIALNSDDALPPLRFSSGGVLRSSRIDLTGLGVRLRHSSTGYAGCGRYAIED